MSRKIPGCELETTIISKEHILEICTFLETWQLTAIEAQIVLEVANCRQHHIGLRDLSRRIPIEFGNIDIDHLTKKLVQEGFLQVYESKKDDLCVRSTSLGRDVSFLVSDLCYSESLRHIPNQSQTISESDHLLCYDPQGFKVGEKRLAVGQDGKKIEITIRQKSKSDKIFRETKDKKPVYDINISAQLYCPQCGLDIAISYCYNPASCYRDYFQVCCGNCKLSFMLRHALDNFYYSDLL